MARDTFFGRNMVGQAEWELRGANDARIKSAETRLAALESADTALDTRLDTAEAELALIDSGAWSVWTPTLTQSGTVTHTVNSATYTRIGRTISFFVDLSVTGTGTGGNNVTVSLPVTARTSGGGVGVIGSGTLLDSSAGTRHNGPAATPSSTTVGILPGNSNANAYLGVGDFTAGLASGDRIQISGTYEAAS